MNAGKGGVDVLGMMTLHLADEAQGQVQVLRRDPARAGQAVAEVAQAAAQGVGQGNGNEETHGRSEEHTSELQSIMRISYAVFCLKNTQCYSLITRRTSNEYNMTQINHASQNLSELDKNQQRHAL